MSKNQNEKAKSLPRPQTAKNPSKINNIEMNSHLGLENENSNLDPTSFTKTYYSKNQNHKTQNIPNLKSTNPTTKNIPPLINNFQKKNNGNGNENKGNEFSRMRPKNIPQDKEKLYEETLFLKSKINELKDENTKLKARLSNLEKETLKYQKYLDEIENVGILKISTLKPNYESSRFVGSLKKQMKEMKEDLKIKEDELNKYKKNIKFTRIREIQIENQNYYNETRRLKKVIEQIYPNILDNEKNQNKFMIDDEELSIFNAIRKENSEIISKNRFLEIEVGILKEKNDVNLQKKIEDFLKINSDLEKEIKRLEHENRKLKSKQELPKTPTNISKDDETTVSKVNASFNEVKENEKEKLLNIIKTKENVILLLEKKLESIALEQQEYYFMQSNQIDEFKEALELETRKSSMWQKKYLEIQVLSKIKEEKYDVLEDIEEEPNSFQEISISKKNIENQKDNKKNSKIEESKIPEENKTISINLQKENSTNEKPIKIVDSIASTTKTNVNENKLGKKEKMKFAKISKISIDDVLFLGEELYYHLLANQMPFNEIERTLKNSNEKDVFSIKDLIEIFKKAPFNLKEDKEIEKLSRYLIENDEKDYVFLDYSKSFEKEFVISSLKQLIGNYMIFTEQNEKDIIKQLQMVFERKKKELNKFIDEEKKIDRKKLAKFFKNNNIDLNSNQFDYLMMKLIQETKMISEIPIKFLKDNFEKILDAPNLKKIDEINNLETKSIEFKDIHNQENILLLTEKESFSTKNINYSEEDEKKKLQTEETFIKKSKNNKLPPIKLINENATKSQQEVKPPIIQKSEINVKILNNYGRFEVIEEEKIMESVESYNDYLIRIKPKNEESFSIGEEILDYEEITDADLKL